MGTHPDLYDIDQRQRVCNVCKAEFTCPPPTRTELLASFTGAELASLIEEGSLIGSAEHFSSEMEQQVSVYPEAIQHAIVCRHWVRGVFLIVKVVEDRAQPRKLNLEDDEARDMLLQRLGHTGRVFTLRGRRFFLAAEGELGSLTEDSPAER